MASIAMWTEFFGWCSVINIGMLTVGAVFLILLRAPISRIHARLFGLSEAEVSLVYFHYLAQYKTAIFIFNITPYIALRMMG
jgi:hypothetical protein